MTKRSFTLVTLFATLILLSVGWGFLQKQRQEDLLINQRRFELLEEDNKRLRGIITEQHNAKTKVAHEARRAEIEKSVSTIRKLKFLQPVVYESLTRKELKTIVEKKLSEQYTDQEFKNMEVSLAAIGLIKPGLPLKQTIINLLGEQIAAFYDQHEHQLFMFENASLENAQNRVILAHELTHALQDQNFGLQNLALEVKDNDDKACAASSLVEGDATIVMTEYMVGDISWQGIGQSLMGAVAQNMEQLEQAPRYLRETLLFPYMTGQEFCMAVQTRGGRAALSEAFEDPPLSTSQILHPKKYLDHPREDPVQIEWKTMEIMGEKPISDNVLGELGARILFSEWLDEKLAKTASEGWKGDRYLVYGNEIENHCILKTVWDTSKDATQFFETTKSYLRKRYEGDFSETGEGFVCREKGKSRKIDLKRQPGNTVILLDCGNEEWSAEFHKKFLSKNE